MSEATIQLRDKGVITLPISLRCKYGLRAGDVFSVSDLGGSTRFLSIMTVQQIGGEICYDG